ncbi:hypothetical protein NO263_01070, partial [Gluconacetobacter entanii]
LSSHQPQAIKNGNSPFEWIQKGGHVNISDILKAEIIMYSTYSLAAADHTALIYEKVCLYLSHKGVL